MNSTLNTMTVNFPVAPTVTMPEPLQTIFLWATIIGTLVIIAYAIALAKKYKSAIPLLMVVGAGAAIPMEAMVGFLGHVVHPSEGSIDMFSALNRVIPWHMFFAYVAGFGLMYLVFFSKMMQGGATPKFVWTSCAVGVFLYIVVEMYPVQAGLWVYYDHQPLWLWKGMAPITWSFMNIASEIMGAALIYLLLPYLIGIRQLLVVVLAPIGAFMGHLGSGWPMYLIINSEYSDSEFLVQLSGVLAIAMALIVMWICRVILTRPTHG